MPSGHLTTSGDTVCGHSWGECHQSPGWPALFVSGGAGGGEPWSGWRPSEARPWRAAWGLPDSCVSPGLQGPGEQRRCQPKGWGMGRGGAGQLSHRYWFEAWDPAGPGPELGDLEGVWALTPGSSGSEYNLPRGHHAGTEVGLGASEPGRGPWAASHLSGLCLDHLRGPLLPEAPPRQHPPHNPFPPCPRLPRRGTEVGREVKMAPSVGDLEVGSGAEVEFG